MKGWVFASQVPKMLSWHLLALRNIGIAKRYLADNTTEQDLVKANFVLIKSEESGCTKTYFNHFS